MNPITRLRRRIARAWMAYWIDVAESTPRRHLMSASDDFPRCPGCSSPLCPDCR